MNPKTSRISRRTGAVVLTLLILAMDSNLAFGQACTFDAMQRLTGVRYGVTNTVSYSRDTMGLITNWVCQGGFAETDTDADALPDAWEYVWFDLLTNTASGDYNQDTISNLKHFEDGTDPTDPDTDGDGMSNVDELSAGSSPTNAASCFQMETFSRTNAPGIIVRWQSFTGKKYRLQRASNLVAETFSNLRTNITATPAINVHTDETATGAGPYHYRVQVE
ncbi:MAG: hypothetical protein KJ626_00470 [Verrucomicrobia bacterium]|nr:hypothetical protein [Verrucomicrobiota bacterium]